DKIQAVISRDAAVVQDQDQPWKTPNAAGLDSRSVADWLAGVDGPEMAKSAVGAQMVADNGVALDRQSYLGMLAMVKGGGLDKFWTETEVYHCKGGNQQLARKLAEAIGEERIHLNSPASDVRFGGDSVVVTCPDGRTFTADDAILAIPPS